MGRGSLRLSLTFLLLGGAAWGQIPTSIDSDQIPKYRVLRPGLAVGAQPSPEALASLKEKGFKTVVNLRTAAEGPATEKDVVEAQGLRYVSVPISPSTFSEEDVQAVAKVLDDTEAAPVLLHCASANRVGAVWAVLRVKQGLSLDEAEAAGREIGLSGPPMIEAMRRVAASFRHQTAFPGARS